MRVVVRRVSTGQRVERETPGRDRDGGWSDNSGGRTENNNRDGRTFLNGCMKGIGEEINWLVVIQCVLKEFYF